MKRKLGKVHAQSFNNLKKKQKNIKKEHAI